MYCFSESSSIFLNLFAMKNPMMFSTTPFFEDLPIFFSRNSKRNITPTNLKLYYFASEQFGYPLEHQVLFCEVSSECRNPQRKSAFQVNYTRFEGGVLHVVRYEMMNVSGMDDVSKNLHWEGCGVRGEHYCYQSYQSCDLMRCRSYFFDLKQLDWLVVYTVKSECKTGLENF